MVIGNGLVARRFETYKQDDGFLVFASGVSNSKTTNPEAYSREINLLTDSIHKYNDKSFVYFSTCSIYDPEEKESAYVRHKISIENIIQAEVKQYHIFRVSNLAGISANPNTLLNYLFYHIKNSINFDLWIMACRNIIDIDNTYLIIDHILQNNLFKNQVTNIANPISYPIKEIVTAIESFLAIKSNYIEINKGGCFDINVLSIQPIVQNLGIRFDQHYLAGLLKKYF